MPAHQQWQQYHRHEGNNCNCNNSKNPVYRQQQRHCNESNDASSATSNKGNNASSTTAETLMRIDNSNVAIMMRASIAIGTMVKTSPH